MLNPLATAFSPAASGPNGGGGAAQSPPLKCPAFPSADQSRLRLGDARGAAESAPTKFRIEEEDVRLSVLSSVSPAAKHSPSVAINSTGAFTGCPADRHSSHDLQRGSDSRGSGPSAPRQIDAQNCREGIPVPPPVFAPAGPAALCDNAATSAERLESIIASGCAEPAKSGNPIRGAMYSAPTVFHISEGASGVRTPPSTLPAGSKLAGYPFRIRRCLRLSYRYW